MSPSLVILYEDSDCLAVAKPAGQFTQGHWAPPGELSLESAVRRHLRPDDPDSAYLGIVHRLDRPTSGVLLWAKTPKAARRLSAEFEKRRASKEYWAIVELGRSAEDSPGHPARARFAGTHEETWCDWLTRPGQSGLVRVVAPETPGARLAMTRVQSAPSAALLPGCAWLRLWPQTGRTHQLRAQAATRGMPILGDREYGAATAPVMPHTIALHARSLEIRHPILQTPMTLVAPVPPEWHTLGVSEGGSG
jgi:23S rRNA pseudouridine1911/1915/1917 synthase